MEAFIEEGLRWWLHLWPHLITLGIFALDIVLSAHAILTKKDTRSTIAWVGLIWFSPGFGAIAYTLFGVNRIRSRATRLRAGTVRVEHEVSGCVPDSARLAEAIGPPDSPLRSLAVLVGRVTERPLTDGNVIEPLDGGDEAYPAMLEAIHGANRSIGLSSYIFDNDPAGRLFVDALAAATRRGVAVRVLIDGIGSTYSSPPITGLLEAQGVPTATFLPATVPFFFPYANLRNHRKIMVVDGRIGFTGGLNIREGCWLSHAPRHPVRDMHFRLHGPVVAHLLEVFAEDWAFACGDAIDGDGTDSDPWRPDFVASGTSTDAQTRHTGATRRAPEKKQTTQPRHTHGFYDEHDNQTDAAAATDGKTDKTATEENSSDASAAAGADQTDNGHHGGRHSRHGGGSYSRQERHRYQRPTRPPRRQSRPPPHLTSRPTRLPTRPTRPSRLPPRPPRLRARPT